MQEPHDGQARTRRWVAGVDGCQAGWVVVLRDPDSGQVSARVLPSFQNVLSMPEAPSVIAVDVPIGLLAKSTPRGRACEVATRPRLGARYRSVFSAPARTALAAFRAGGGYEAVCVASRGRRALQQSPCSCSESSQRSTKLIR